MLPAQPVPDLVLAQARLALGPLQAFLDPVRRLGHACQFRERHLWVGGRQIVIMLERTVRLKLAGHEQQLLRARAPRRRPSPDPTRHGLHRQRPDGRIRRRVGVVALCKDFVEEMDI